MSNETKYFLHITIADLCVKVSCHDSGVYKQLVTRYDHFSSLRNESISVELNLDHKQSVNNFENPKVKFRDGIALFENCDYEGFIDILKGNAQIRISSSNLIEGVDYFLRVVFALFAFDKGGILFHGAGIIRNDQGYVFFGPSGSGKSTVSRLSRDSVILNDDLVLLYPNNDSWQVYATPFWNKFTLSPPADHAQLNSLYRLIQDKKVYLEKMEKGSGIAELIASIPVVSCDPSRNSELIDRCLDLLITVPIFRLHFLPDKSFWTMVTDS